MSLLEELYKTTFTVVDPDVPNGEYKSASNPAPWISLSKNKFYNDLLNLKDSNDIVISKPIIKVVFDYPLKDKHIIELSPPAGENLSRFTRGSLAKVIILKYHQIYGEEEATTTLPVESIAARNKRLGVPGWPLGNRAKTDGKWGISKHGLDDLDLSEVEYDPKQDVYYLCIES